MRIIDADLLYKALSEEAIHRMQHSSGSNFDIGRTNGIIYSRDMIKNAPTIEPVKRGEWIETRPADSGGPACYKCSECGEKYRIGGSHNFCPNCGAKMEQEG